MAYRVFEISWAHFRILVRNWQAVHARCRKNKRFDADHVFGAEGRSLQVEKVTKRPKMHELCATVMDLDNGEWRRRSALSTYCNNDGAHLHMDLIYFINVLQPWLLFKQYITNSRKKKNYTESYKCIQMKSIEWNVTIELIRPCRSR